MLQKLLTVLYWHKTLLQRCLRIYYSASKSVIIVLQSILYIFLADEQADQTLEEDKEPEKEGEGEEQPKTPEPGTNLFLDLKISLNISDKNARAV